jgi:thiol-disulfide isomerase/thioredoxin
MKRFFVLLPGVLLLSCKPDPKNNTITHNLSGTIRNAHANSITIAHVNGFQKKVPINKNGHFSVNLPADARKSYMVLLNNQRTDVYINSKTQLTMSADADSLIQTLSYKGAGAQENNFLAAAGRDELRLAKTLPDDADINQIRSAVDTLMATREEKLAASHLDLVFIKNAIKSILPPKDFLIHRLDKRYVDKGLKGKPSPLFSYEDIHGKTVSLTDFRGKYVYIDLWATWCEICLMDMPLLNQMKKDLSGKNIVFISLSVDEQKNKEKWKRVVAREKMEGIQLIADKAKQSAFIKAYAIRSIPRFILIDPKGNVVDANAKPPGDPALTAQLEIVLK